MLFDGRLKSPTTKLEPTGYVHNTSVQVLSIRSIITIDSFTSNIPLVNAGGVASYVDATYGNVASFNATLSYTFTRFMSDFRVYDNSLASADILQLFNEGPNPPPVLTVTMYTHVAYLEWEDVSGASTYRVTSTEDTFDETELATTVFIYK